MHPAVLLAFALAVLPLSLTPGVSSALVTTRVLSGGRAEGLKVAAGTACGLYVHATLAAVGLAAVVMASSRAFVAVKLAGAAYLVVLGTAALLRRRDRTARTPAWSGHGSWAQAFLGNVLNPKAAGVYLTLLPQFVDAGRPLVPQIYLLATVHVAVAVGVLSLLSCAVAALGGALHGARDALQRLTGLVLVLLGVRAAVTA